MRSRCGINTLKYRIGWIEKFFDVLTIWLIVFWILVMCQLSITEVTDIHVQIIDESVGGIANAECVKETYLLDTEDVYVGHLFLAISKYLTWDATK